MTDENVVLHVAAKFETGSATAAWYRIAGRAQRNEGVGVIL
jgi:hypothetical protein